MARASDREGASEDVTIGKTGEVEVVTMEEGADMEGIMEEEDMEDTTEVEADALRMLSSIRELRRSSLYPFVCTDVRTHVRTWWQEE